MAAALPRPPRPSRSFPTQIPWTKQLQLHVRELSMEQIPVEPPLGHCACRLLVGRVHLPP